MPVASPTRAILSGPPAAQGAAWRRWLLRSAPGRVLLFGVAVKIAAGLARFVAPDWDVLAAVDVVGSLALVFVGAYGIGRGVVWARRRLLWRVRRKLILSYIFVGLVPGLLIIAFFLLAGLALFFNVSSYLVQSRVQSLADQAQFFAQAIVLEAEHNEPAAALTRRIAQRQAAIGARFPFTSIALVPVEDKTCEEQVMSRASAPRLVQAGPWQHLDPPAGLPAWVPCDGFAGLVAYAAPGDDEDPDTHLVMRAVALPHNAAPTWAVVVDLPFTGAIAERVRGETGIELGEVFAAPAGRAPALPGGRRLEPRSRLPDGGATLGGEWVAILTQYDWQTGASNTATVGLRLNWRETYERISALATGRDFGRVLLIVLGVIGGSFFIIQAVALVIGFALARQITGAVHDLFTGTEHLRNRDFSHPIPVRARDQLGELAESFNLMTHEVTMLLKENAEKARLEQEMLAAREIQQRLLPSGPFHIPGLEVIAFCEPAREVAGDYYDLLPLSDRRTGVLIADVSGKGLPAGLYMAQLKVLVQSLARVHSSPREFLIAINRVVADNIDAKSFITMSYLVLDLDRREMTFARAGHCPLLFVPGSAPPGMRTVDVLAPDGLVLGLKIDDGQMFDAMLQEITIPLADGDVIALFTDGISETMNADFDCYGEHRLAKVLEQYAHLPFPQLRSFIFADLRAFAGDADQHDDMTMILVKVAPERA